MKRERIYDAIPFLWVLEDKLNQLPLSMRRQFALGWEDEIVFSGVMRRIIRRKGFWGLLLYPMFWLGRFNRMLFPETGENVPFELRIFYRTDRQGPKEMLWERTFYFPNATRRFDSALHYHDKHSVLIDRLGQPSPIEMELHPRVEGTRMVVESGRQWARLPGLRIPLPRFMQARGFVEEWESEDGKLEMRAMITNGWLGEILRFEGWFAEASSVKAE